MENDRDYESERDVLFMMLRDSQVAMIDESRKAMDNFYSNCNLNEKHYEIVTN